jgi:molybdenum cofactor cytidylyltransferase
VILAAGESSRLGYDKLSLPLGEKSVLEHTVSKFLIDSVSEIVIVTGKFVPECRSSIASSKVLWVNNTDYLLGMSSSIRKGIEHIHASADGVFITPADIPLFAESTVRLMMQTFVSSKIIIPTHHRRKGHPVLMSRNIAQQCLTIKSEKVLYDVINENQNAVELLPVEDEGIVLDIDTNEDYEVLKEYYDKYIDH